MADDHHTTNLQYWGWCKYRYREIPKKTFAEAKEAALDCLNACPVDVIPAVCEPIMAVYWMPIERD